MKCARFFAMLGVLFLVAYSSLAQTTTTGAINGTLLDQSGAVVPGATVVLTDNATGGRQDVKSSNSGAYRFDLVKPGNYTISVDHPGFVQLKSTLSVSNSQVVSADLKLTVGSESTVVNIDTVATLLNAENGNVATTVSQAQIEEVPNSGNNIVYSTKLAPGFNTGFGVVGSTSYQINGMNFNDPYNNSNNSGASNLMLGLNDVQETSITSNGYSGQYGGLIGAQVSVVTKSGGNRLHGNAAWFWSGRALVANTYLHKAATPIVARSFENANQWAAAISGPVTIPHLFHGKDRLFFLADAEGLRAVLPATPVTVLLPSANLQTYTRQRLVAQGLSASIPYYENMFRIYNKAGAAHNATPGNPNLTGAAAQSTGCPTSSTGLSTTDRSALGALPGACTYSYASTATTFANEALEIFRLDAVLGNNDKAYIRYSHDSGTQPTTTDPIDPLFNAISIQPEHNGQFNETHTFGTRAVNNFILASSWYGALFGPSDLNAQLTEFPAQLGLGDSSLSTLGGSIASYPTGRNITSIQLEDDVALTFGSHTVKFGGKEYVTKENDHYFTAGTVPNESVATLGAFINGGYDPAFSTIVNGATNYTNATTFVQTFPTKSNRPVLINQFAGYVEDDWKASRALSMSFALRLEHQGNIQCLDSCITQLAADFQSLNHNVSIPYNQAYVFNQKDVLPGLQKLEWQPRVGFAYNPSLLKESLVIRGGFGIFYDGLPGNILEGLAKNPPTKNSFSVSQDHLANTETTSNLWLDTAAFNTAFTNGIASGGTVASIKASLPTAAERNSFTPPNVYTPQGPQFKMYSVNKWNLEVQKSFGSKTVLSLNYLGNHGIHKPLTNGGLNAFSTTGAIAGLPAAQPDPRFGIVYYYQPSGSNNYNGLITTFTRRFDGGSIFTAGYTFGKILDTGANGFSTTTAIGTTDIGGPPNPYNVGRTYGPAATDERHNLTLNYVYKVPFHNIFYGGWEVSGTAFAYSGLPITVIDTATTTSISSYANGAYGNSLIANYNGGGQAKCNYGGDVCLTASQFSKATSVNSNAPRNGFRGPAYISTDLAVEKAIPLHWEGGSFNVSAQAFNVLNHLNFTKPTGSLNSSSFGKVTTTINPSGLFSGVGGDDSPRILQLKAKVVF